MAVFETSYGREITVYDNYRQAHGVHSAGDTLADHDTYDTGDAMSFGGFLKDRYEYGLVFDFVDSLGIEVDWERSLDIGCAEGAIARFIKGDGLAARVEGIDINDMSGNLPPNRFMKFHALFSGGSVLRRVLPPLRDRWRMHISEGAFGYRAPSCSRFWRPGARIRPSIDDYLVGDAVEYDFDGTYDLVTAFLCLEYFDPTAVFSKVESILADRGVFAFLVNYWWWPVNSTRIVGDFPYAAQRLTREDLARYFEEFHPEEKEDALSRYDYFHKGVTHPTLEDYVNLAENAGLSFVGGRRLTPQYDTHPKTVVAPRKLRTMADFDVEDVLEDIRQFRSDVTAADLQTAFALCVFTKDSSGGESLADHVADVGRGNEPGIYHGP